jgi:MFS family permease
MKSVSNRILAMKFFAEFILVYPIIPIMFNERGGVSAGGIGLIFGLTYALIVLFEVPTGIIADKVPRKYVLVADMICKTLAVTTWFIWPGFWGYLIGSVFFALNSSLESGALQAYLYGTLGHDDQKSFGKFWSRVHAMIMLSYTSAYVLAFSIGVKYNVFFIISLVSCLTAVTLSISLPKDSLATAHMEVKPKIFKTAVSHIFHSVDLLRLLLVGIVVVAFAELITEYASLYYRQVGLDTRFVIIMMCHNFLDTTFLGEFP